jgi:hypothetical protein
MRKLSRFIDPRLWGVVVDILLFFADSISLALKRFYKKEDEPPEQK